MAPKPSSIRSSTPMKFGRAASPLVSAGRVAAAASVASLAAQVPQVRRRTGATATDGSRGAPCRSKSATSAGADAAPASTATAAARVARGAIRPRRPDPNRAIQAAVVASSESVAALRIQAWYRGRLGRFFAQRRKMMIEQRRMEEQMERESRARREAKARAAREAEEAKQTQVERKREAKLRAFRDRRCAVEQMLMGLKSRSWSWEEDPNELLQMLEQASPQVETWLGRHETRRSARKQYLALARRWHPDKWAMSGEECVAVATEVTKLLVQAFEKAQKDLPRESMMASCEDDDEEKEVYEFASWVGVAWPGMFDVWKQRKQVTCGTEKAATRAAAAPARR